MTAWLDHPQRKLTDLASSADSGISELPPLVVSQCPDPDSSALLPAAYGLPMLDLLVVDPEYLFIAWEISGEQLTQARQQLGSGFENRKLVARLVTADNLEIGSVELHGEVGRWFYRLARPGVTVRAVLQFEAGDCRFELHQTGYVQIPRVSPVEPEAWQQLTVEYRQVDGRLSISRIQSATEAALPAGLSSRALAVSQTRLSGGFWSASSTIAGPYNPEATVTGNPEEGTQDD